MKIWRDFHNGEYIDIGTVIIMSHFTTCKKLYLAKIVFPVTVFPRNNKLVHNCKIIISTQNIIPPSVACKKMD